MKNVHIRVEICKLDQMPLSTMERYSRRRERTKKKKEEGGTTGQRLALNGSRYTTLWCVNCRTDKKQGLIQALTY